MHPTPYVRRLEIGDTAGWKPALRQRIRVLMRLPWGAACPHLTRRRECALNAPAEFARRAVWRASLAQRADNHSPEDHLFVTTEDTVTETNRLQGMINSTPAPHGGSTFRPPDHAVGDRRAARPPRPRSSDFGAVIRRLRRSQGPLRAAGDRTTASPWTASTTSARRSLIRPRASPSHVAYVMQDHPGLAYVMHPPAEGEKVGRMETTPLVLV